MVLPHPDRHGVGAAPPATDRLRRLVVASEDPLDGEIFADALKGDAGWTVGWVAGLSGCVRAYCGQVVVEPPRLPNLLVLDVRVPDLVVTRTLRRLRGGALAGVPIVVLTEMDDADGTRDCHEAQATAVMVKPLAPCDLRQTARLIATRFANGVAPAPLDA